MFKISIPKPCFEGWENMLPNEQGRYCNACAKTVIDFSVMSDEAVQQYFISNYGNSICGRFKNTQLQRIVISLPQNIFHIQLPFWKRFLVVLLICFGGNFLGIDIATARTSFMQGTPVAYTSKKIKNVKTLKHDPLRKKHRRKKREEPFIVFEGTVTGNIWGAPPDPPFRSSCNPFDSANYKTPAQSKNADTGTSVKSDNMHSNPKKDKPSKYPIPDTAFIVPAVFAARNPFSKKKKLL